MAEYRLSRLAEADLEGIVDYTASTYGLRQAEIYIAQLRSAAEAAAEIPMLGMSYATRAGRAFRKYNSGQHALFYQPAENGILIVRILHLAMDFDRHLDGRP